MTTPSMLPPAPAQPPVIEPRYVGVMRHRLRAALSENTRLKRELFMVRQQMATQLARFRKAAS
jgi:hypothetical protein